MTAPVATADQVLRQIMADPRRATADAEASLADARTRRDGAGVATAYRALGLAAHALHDAAAAAAHLRRAIRAAERCGEATVEAECRMSYALVLDDRGSAAAALREIDRACGRLTGLRLARAVMQRALILRRVGRDDDALAGYQRALTVFRQHGDALWEGRVLVNRGVLRGYRGELGPARHDLRAAVRIFTELDMPSAVAQTRHNLGFLAAQAGDVTTALTHYDQARDQLSYIGAAAVTQLDRAELLLAARLLPEARTAVTEAVDAARAGEFSALLGQAQLLSARIELACGAGDLARTIAGQARATFLRQHRPIWAVLARRIEVSARVAAGGPDRRSVRALEQAGDDLAAAAWLPRAWDAWVDAAHLAVELGDPVTAARCLAKAAGGRRSGPAPLRARAWHAAALIALCEGRAVAARRHLAAGYREIEQHQASLGATELGMRGAAAGVRIAGLRLRLALDGGDLRGALTWLQRARSVALRLPPARPSDDPVVEARLAELRAISTEVSTTAIDSPRVQRLLRRQRAVETEIRQRSWLAPGAPAAARTPPTLAELSATLADRALVELGVLDGDLHALVVVDGRIRHRRLCPVGAAADELTALRFAIRQRVVYPGGAVAARADAAVAYSAGELDRLLLLPLADLVADRPLVVAPTGQLHALPWAMLPSCRGRAVAVSPSSWQWWQAQQRSTDTFSLVLAAGPAPQHATTEVTELHTRHPDAVALTGAAATVAATLAALDGVAVGHIASHGVFRADNPLFSHLILADGPLTVCDLSALRRPPSLLVLSSCDAGLSAVHPGDELQGLAAALLGLGTRTIIAGLGPVGDEDTLHLMTRLHQQLGRGLPAAAALGLAQAEGERPVSAANFVCLGAG